MENECPFCRIPLKQDYWDIIEEQEDGSFVMDVFEAWVCGNFCGYYEKIEGDNRSAELHIWWKLKRKK